MAGEEKEIEMRYFVGFVLAALATGCSAHYPGSPTPTPTLAAVRVHYVNPHEALSPGSSTSLALYAIDSEGVYELVSSRATWFSSNTAVVTVTTLFIAAIGVLLDRVAASDDGEDPDRG